MNSCNECEHSKAVDFELVCQPCLSNNRSKFERKKGKMKVKVVLEDGAIMPTRAHDTDAGYDLYARDYAIIDSGEAVFFDTGVHIEIPKGYVGFVKAKSGLNRHRGLTCTGVIDSGYTGSIGVTLRNHNGGYNVAVSKGMKIAQLVILPIITPELEQVDSLEGSDRGSGGFGSTGEY
jgi:dUTP pyrophosphatase